MDTSLLSSLSGIYYEESNLDFLLPSPLYFNWGANTVCAWQRSYFYRCPMLSFAGDVRDYFLGWKYHAIASFLR